MANENRIVVNAEEPLEVVFVDRQHRATTVLTIAPDPADATGASVLLTLGTEDTKTNVLGTLENDGEPISAGGGDLTGTSLTIVAPETVLAARVAGSGFAMWGTQGPFGSTGSSGADAGIEQGQFAADRVIDVDPLTFIAGDGGTSVTLITAAPLPACTAAGTGVGKTLTGDAVGVLTVDGVAVTAGMTILVKDQVDPVDNGYYDCTTEGTGGAAFVLTRSTEMDETGDETEPGRGFGSADQGTVNIGLSYQLDGDYEYLGPLELNGVTLALGDTVLNLSLGGGQDNARRRGLYVVTVEGVAGPVGGGGGVPWEMTRATTMDSSAEIVDGVVVEVAEGDTLTGGWVLPPGDYTLGSSTLVWTAFSGSGTSITLEEMVVRTGASFLSNVGVDGNLGVSGQLTVSNGAGADIDGNVDINGSLTLFNADRYVLSGRSGTDDEFFDAATINGASLSDGNEQSDVEIPAGAATASLQVGVNGWLGMEKIVQAVADGGGSVTVTSSYRSKAGDGAQPVSFTLNAVNDSVRLKLVNNGVGDVWQIRQVTGTAVVNY